MPKPEETNEAWVDRILTMVEEKRPTKPRKYVPDTLVTSKATGRRGKITYANRRWLTVEFNEHTGASKDYTIKDFERLWRVI